jgi:hypothetical protein
MNNRVGKPAPKRAEGDATSASADGRRAHGINLAVSKLVWVLADQGASQWCRVLNVSTASP